MVYTKKPDVKINPPNFAVLREEYEEERFNVEWDRYNLTHDLLLLFQHGQITQADLTRWLVGLYEVNSASSVNSILALSPAFLEEVKRKTLALIKRQLKENPRALKATTIGRKRLK